MHDGSTGDAALLAGDVVFRCADQAIEGPEDIATVLAASTADQVPILLSRDEAIIELQVARESLRGRFEPP